MSDSAGSRLDAFLAVSLVGAGAGAATADLPGAVIGATTPAAVRAVTWVAREFRERVLGHREEIRVVDVLTVAKNRIEARLAAGDPPRADGFFELGTDDWSDAHELLEGVVLAAEREHEERKIHYYGNLWANIAFEPAIDRVTANSLLREAEDLSYTQLQLLALVRRRDAFPLPETSVIAAEGVSRRAASVRHALDDLGYAKRELVGPRRQSGYPLPENIGAPGGLVMRSRGELFFVLMNLDDISVNELHSVADDLWEFAGTKPPRVVEDDLADMDSG